MLPGPPHESFQNRSAGSQPQGQAAHIEGARVSGQHPRDLGIGPLPVGRSVRVKAVLGFALAIQRGNRQGRLLAGRHGHRGVHPGLGQLLADQAPERVSPDPAQEAGAAAQAGQADRDIARGAPGPGLELLGLARAGA